ncbi:hypothetical protein C8R45DRAFT_1043333 [Mycena sanguinolenta]|nr:hypothetical protein C8R45DRAFT_1043333 [Mycena sanguinolenta]
MNPQIQRSARFAVFSLGLGWGKRIRVFFASFFSGQLVHGVLCPFHCNILRMPFSAFYIASVAMYTHCFFFLSVFPLL